jgi:hypothetical protein
VVDPVADADDPCGSMDSALNTGAEPEPLPDAEAMAFDADPAPEPVAAPAVKPEPVGEVGEGAAAPAAGDGAASDDGPGEEGAGGGEGAGSTVVPDGVLTDGNQERILDESPSEPKYSTSATTPIKPAMTHRIGLPRPPPLKPRPADRDIDASIGCMPRTGEGSANPPIDSSNGPTSTSSNFP